MRKILLNACLLLAAVTGMLAQPVTDDLPRITGCIALVNATVVTAPGKEPSPQNVIMRDGLITAIGPQAKIPADAYQILADSLFVYPAFIDACSYIGIKEPEAEGNRGNQGGNRERPAFDTEGNVSLEEAGITPFNEVRATFDPKEKSVADWRAQGFAIAHIVPRGRMIPGKGAVAVLTGNTTDKMLWKENISIYGQWTGSGNNYPSTIIGVMAKWRELYHNASQQVSHLASYAAGPQVRRPEYNHAHEALMPLVKKEIPLFFRAPKVKDISRALTMQQDLGMKMVIADAEEAWLLKEQIRSKNIPIVLSLDLPEDKAEKAEGQKGGKETENKAEGQKAEGQKAEGSTAEMAEGQKAEKDSVKIDPEKEAFEKRRAQSLKEHREQAAVLAKENIPFSFGTISGKTSDFSKNIQLMVEHGLDKNAALNALTLQPARLLGIDTYCGTLELGKMANVIVTNKPLFEKETGIRYMIVEGNLYAYEIKEKKKSNGKDSPVAVKALEGIWSYSVEMPDQKREGTFEFAVADGDVTGTISSPDLTSGNNRLENIIVDGDNVSFEFDFDAGGQLIALEFDLILTGETFEGTVIVGEMGSFPINGARTSKPE